jgi:hypothetical protein
MPLCGTFGCTCSGSDAGAGLCSAVVDGITTGVTNVFAGLTQAGVLVWLL